MKPSLFVDATGRGQSHGAFSLVEVAIALGIVSFGLVAVLGTLPVAMTSSRESIAQTRASELASSIFAGFRAQPFGSVCYVDEQFGSDGITPSGGGPLPIDLQKAMTDTSQYSNDRDPSAKNVDNSYIRFYASIVETSGSSTDPTKADPTKVKYSVVRPAQGYQVILHFNPAPDGDSGQGVGNKIDMLVSEMDHPNNFYRFTSTISNITGNLNLSQL